MPNRRKRSRRARGSGRQMPQQIIHREVGNCELTLINAATNGTIAVNPVNFGTRLSQLADNFTQFRFNRIHISYARVGATEVAVSYIAGSVQTIPNTFTVISDIERVSWSHQVQTTPSSLNIPRSVLRGESSNMWFKVGAGTDSDTQGEVQGNIIAALKDTGTARTIIGLCHYEVEFCGDADPSSVPLMLKRFGRLELASKLEVVDKFNQELLKERVALASTSALLGQEKRKKSCESGEAQDQARTCYHS